MMGQRSVVIFRFQGRESVYLQSTMSNADGNVFPCSKRMFSDVLEDVNLHICQGTSPQALTFFPRLFDSSYRLFLCHPMLWPACLHFQNIVGLLFVLPQCKTNSVTALWHDIIKQLHLGVNQMGIFIVGRHVVVPYLTTAMVFFEHLLP